MSVPVVQKSIDRAATRVPLRRAGGGVALSAAFIASLPFSATLTAAQPSSDAAGKEAFYGELHLHTNYSFDAYIMGATAVDPDAAYRFGKGEEIQFFGQTIRRREPLDFMAVTDHSELIGVMSRTGEKGSAISQTPFGTDARRLAASKIGPDGRPRGGGEFDAESIPPSVKDLLADWLTGKNPLPKNLQDEVASAWRREIDFANRHYTPGKFTTFIAYEWTAHVGGSGVLHRNVIFRGDSAPDPFTARDSQRPEDLWAWLQGVRDRGYEVLAIPHNGNLSSGYMYDWNDSDGKPIDSAYARARQANEPLSEISQTKGATETHPLLSPNDEFAEYEIMERLVGGSPYRPGGSYLRDALQRGLVLQRKLSVNPYKYGFVGASDLHTGVSVSAQADYNGGHTGTHLGGSKATQAEGAAILGAAGKARDEWNRRIHTSGNLTGVWAERNTRESIYDALRRKETFATTGTRIKLRFFGGWNFSKGFLQQKEWVATAYERAVPMGGNLPAHSGNGAPTFAVWAVKDPNGANLDRAQIVKVWEENGRQREKVFDVAWSGNRMPDPRTASVPAVGNTVDLKTGTFTNDIGAVELKTVWQDPEFNPRQFAAYYLRVLEIPTPRWTTLLAVEAGAPLPTDVPATVQLRGWSSPIWFAPGPRFSRGDAG